VAVSFDVVIPTAGRPSLSRLLDALKRGRGPRPGRVVVADGRGRGPAAARNAGWRACRSEWVAFLDDDVVPETWWAAELAADLEAVGPEVGAVQGQIRVPRPSGRRPTDWERNVGGLEAARWATADMAYRRSALLAVNGFDERFPRAYREDTDLGLRVTEAGWRIVRGRRAVQHPAGPADRWVSVRRQAGNADDALMDALHGDGWRERGGAPRGTRRRHLATAALGSLALLPPARPLATAAWAAMTADLARRRISPGPRDREEVFTMSLTSAALPFAATAHWLHGVARARRIAGEGRWGEPAAVLFDRDDTLIRDVPYNGDPQRVEAMPGAREAVQRVRDAGLRTAVVSNQSGIARGVLTAEEVGAVNARVADLLGAFDAWAWCPHGPGEGCECRKPQPGLVLRAAAALCVAPHRCVVIGDIGADVQAAEAAGARGILVPTARTLPEETAAAPEVAATIAEAVDRVLHRGPARGAPGRFRRGIRTEVAA
jgi:HAD superfamily hydrolase (TIGR01662 family)